MVLAGSTSRCLSVLCGSVSLISLFGERDLVAENALRDSSGYRRDSAQDAIELIKIKNACGCWHAARPH